jgi:hypothetical protein
MAPKAKKQIETATAPAAEETATMPAADEPVAAKPAPKAKAVPLGPPFYSCVVLKPYRTKGGVVLTPGGGAVLPKATIRGEHLIARGIIKPDPRKLTV